MTDKSADDPDLDDILLQEIKQNSKTPIQNEYGEGPENLDKCSIKTNEKRKIEDLDHASNKRFRGELQNEDEQTQSNFGILEKFWSAKLVSDSLVINLEELHCSGCFDKVAALDGVILYECSHFFCRSCLIYEVEHSVSPIINCPFKSENYNCNSHLQDFEIKSLVNNDLHEAREINSYNCQTPDCCGWCFYNEGASSFLCNICEHLNCIICGTIHEGKSCKQYWDDLELDANNEKNKIDYEELVQLSGVLVPNSEPFSCPVCLNDVASGEGVILHDCFHSFCKMCLVSTVEHSVTPDVKCPFMDENAACQSILRELEIKSLVTQELYEKHLKLSINHAEVSAINSFHCKSPDCSGWCLYEEGATTFNCPICKCNNCLTCAAQHGEHSCENYQVQLRYDKLTPDEKQQNKSEEHIQRLIRNRKAMPCPSCKITTIKIDGCPDVTCAACKRNFKWIPKRIPKKIPKK